MTRIMLRLTLITGIVMAITGCSLFGIGESDSGSEKNDASAELKGLLKALNTPEGIETGTPKAMTDEELSAEQDTENPDVQTLNDVGMPVTYKTTLKKLRPQQLLIHKYY